MTAAARCPHCGPRDVREVLYGYPTDAIRARVRAGKAVVGGCQRWGDERDDSVACGSCGARWGAVEYLERANEVETLLDVYWGDDEDAAKEAFRRLCVLLPHAAST